MPFDTPGSVPTGQRVEVWNRPLGRWTGPYEVTECAPAGVRVQRPRDHSPLPELFNVEELRET